MKTIKLISKILTILIIVSGLFTVLMATTDNNTQYGTISFFTFLILRLIIFTIEWNKQKKINKGE